VLNERDLIEQNELEAGKLAAELVLRPVDIRQKDTPFVEGRRD
jgi:hypothetical protein